MKKTLILLAIMAFAMPIMVSANSMRSACFFFDKCPNGQLTTEEWEAYSEYLATRKPINREIVSLKIKVRELKELRAKILVDYIISKHNVTVSEILKAIGL